MNIETRSMVLFAAFAAGIMLLGPVFQAQSKSQLAADASYILPEAERSAQIEKGEPAGLLPFDPTLTARMAVEGDTPGFKAQVVEASSRNAFVLMTSLRRE